MPPEMNSSTWDVEFRAASGVSDDEAADGRNFSGYAAVFDQPTQIRGWEGTFNERMAKGAFKKTLRESTPVMQFDHGHDSRVGSCPIGHYTDIKEDDNGLAVKARLFDNPVVEPVRQAIEAKAVRGMSIKFNVTKERWRDASGKIVKPEELGQLLYEPGERGPLDREIREVRLMEAGPVVHPAYPQTTAAVRSGDERSERIDNLAANYADTFEDEGREESEDVEVSEENPNEVVNSEEREEAEEAPEDREETSETEEVTDAHENGPSRADQGDITDEDRATSPDTTKSAQAQRRKVEVKMPKTLDELIARQAEVEARLSEMGEAAETRDMTEDEDTEFDALTDERDSLIKSQERITKRMSVLKELAGSDSTERGSDHAPAFHRQRSDEEIYDLAEIRKISSDGDDFLSRVDDSAKRAVERAKYGAKDKSAAQEHVTELLEDVDNEARDLAKRILLTGSAEYERAFAKLLRQGSDALCTAEERAALVRAASVPQALGTDGAGGYAVPFQLDPTVILTSAGVVNPIRDLARVERIVGKEWQGITSAGSTVVRGAEGAEAPDSGFTVAQPTVRTNRVQGFVAFNIEIDLSWNALRTEITNMLVDGKEREEDSFVTGDGTGTNPGGVVGTYAGGTVQCAGAGTFTEADVYALTEAIDPRWERNASFLGHKSVYNKIRQFSPNGPGSSFWVSLGNGTPPRLLDFPDYRSSAMQAYPARALLDADQLLLFGDFSKFLIVDRIGMTVELIPNLLGAFGRPTGQRGVYAVWMNNSKVLVPGAFKLLTGNTA